MTCEPSLRSRSSRWRGVVTTTLGCLLVFVSLPLIAGSFVELMQAKVEQARAARLALLPPPTRKSLHWTYPLPLPRPTVEFDVEHSESVFGPWTLYQRTNQPPVELKLPGFYKVGAHRPT